MRMQRAGDRMQCAGKSTHREPNHTHREPVARRYVIVLRRRREGHLVNARQQCGEQRPWTTGNREDKQYTLRFAWESIAVPSPNASIPPGSPPSQTIQNGRCRSAIVDQAGSVQSLNARHLDPDIPVSLYGALAWSPVHRASATRGALPTRMELSRLLRSSTDFRIIIRIYQ